MFPGVLTHCIKVDDLEASRRFYEALGFTHKVWDMEGQSLVLSNGEVEIALMTFLPGNSMNFRGGDVRALKEGLEAKGLSVDGEITDYDANGDDRETAGSCWMTHDPDGNAVFFDTNGAESGETGRARRLKRLLERTLIYLEEIEAGEDCIKAFRTHVAEPFMPE